MLEKLLPKDFDKMYALMRESFPEDEYRPYAEQKKLLERAEYTVYALYGEKRSVGAFLAVWQFANFSYVEHFAVAPSMRNGGLGGALLTELCDSLHTDVCLEVELPETDMAKRRIRFYERNRFCLNEYPYVQPPISKGKLPLPLQLMTFATPAEAERLEDIKRTLYENVYGVDRNARFL